MGFGSLVMNVPCLLLPKLGLLPPLRDGHTVTAVTSHDQSNFDCPNFPKVSKAPR